MAKNQRNNAINQSIDTGQTALRDNSYGLNSLISNRFNPVAQKSDDLYNQTLSGYSGMIPKWQDLGNQARSTGSGYATKFNKYGDEIAGWARGKLDPGDESRMRGLGVYDEFAKTGGWSDADKSGFMRNAAEATPRFYANMGREVDQANLGNFNPGALALKGRLAREAAHGATADTLGARQNLAESIRSGRMAGAAGAASTEQALQGYYKDRYTGGMGLAGDYFSKGLGADAMGLQGLGDALQGEQGAYNDMRGLYGTSPAELNSLMQLYSQNTLGTAGADQGYIGQNIQNNPRQKPWWQTGLELGIPLATSLATGGPEAKTGSRVGGQVAPSFQTNPWSNLGQNSFQNQRSLWGS